MNRATIIGRITKDIELRYTSNGVAFTSIQVAINNGKDKEGNDRPADFVNVQVWDKQAETLAKYQSKGSKILVEGPIKTDSYTSNDGITKYITYVRATRIIFLEKINQNEEEVIVKMNDPVTPADFITSVETQMNFASVFDSEDNGLPF